MDNFLLDRIDLDRQIGDFIVNTLILADVIAQ